MFVEHFRNSRVATSVFLEIFKIFIFPINYHYSKNVQQFFHSHGPGIFIKKKKKMKY